MERKIKKELFRKKKVNKRNGREKNLKNEKRDKQK